MVSKLICRLCGYANAKVTGPSQDCSRCGRRLHPEGRMDEPAQDIRSDGAKDVHLD